MGMNNSNYIKLYENKIKKINNITKITYGGNECPLNPEDEEFFNKIDSKVKKVLLKQFNTIFQSKFKEQEIKQILVILYKSQNLVSNDESSKKKAIDELKKMSDCFFKNDKVGKKISADIGNKL